MSDGMKIAYERPPNWDDIVAAFPHVDGAPVLFCYGETIFNPLKIAVPAFMMAHESVHAARQKADPAGWWKRYIDDPVFRLKEEVQGHKAELAAVNVTVRDRNQRARNLSITAKRLAAPLYGGIIKYADALCLLQN